MLLDYEVGKYNQLITECKYMKIRDMYDSRDNVANRTDKSPKKVPIGSIWCTLCSSHLNINKELKTVECERTKEITEIVKGWPTWKREYQLTKHKK